MSTATYHSSATTLPFERLLDNMSPFQCRGNGQVVLMELKMVHNMCDYYLSGPVICMCEDERGTYVTQAVSRESASRQLLGSPGLSLAYSPEHRNSLRQLAAVDEEDHDPRYSRCALVLPDARHEHDGHHSDQVHKSLLTYVSP